MNLEVTEQRSGDRITMRSVHLPDGKAFHFPADMGDVELRKAVIARGRKIGITGIEDCQLVGPGMATRQTADPSVARAARVRGAS
jgi:hypothetical protein